MSAAENKRSIIVGLFVFIGVIVLVAGILILGGQQKRFGGSIELHTVFDNVGGLKEGNNIWFSGVKIGTIKKISFTPDRKVAIVMNIESKSQPYIRKDAVAQISSEGFIGNKIIVILGGSNEAPNVESGDELDSQEGNDTEAMLATLQVNNQNLVAITDDIKALSERVREGKGLVGALFTDSVMVDNFKATLSNLQQTSDHAKQLTQSLSTFGASLNQEGTFTHDLVHDTTVFENLRSSVAKLNNISENASAITSNLRDASAQLNENDNTLGMLLQDEETAAQLKSLIQNLETSSATLDENMKALQHNFLFRKYFKKKAKAEAKAQ